MPLSNKHQRFVQVSVFTLALTVSEILRFEMFDLQNLGQGQIRNGPFDGEYQHL